MQFKIFLMNLVLYEEPCRMIWQSLNSLHHIGRFAYVYKFFDMI